MPPPEDFCKELGLPPAEAADVSAFFQRLLQSTHTTKQVVVRDVVEGADVSAEVGRRVLLYLLLRHCLTATFVPRHRRCRSTIGPAEVSEPALQAKIASGYYGSVCLRCHREIDASDVEVEILFWTDSVGVGP